MSSVQNSYIGQSQPLQCRPSRLEHQSPEVLKHKPPHSARISAKEEIGSEDSISQLHPRILRQVFGYLSATELAKGSEVSRRWRRLTSEPMLWNALDLRKISPLLRVIDESDWGTHVDLASFELDVSDAPSFDKHKATPELKRCLHSLQIEGNAGVTLLTMPKGLTLNKLLKIAESPKVGKTSRFQAIWDLILETGGDLAITKTYRIVITNSVFEKSQNLTVSAQKTLLKRIDCQMPRLLEVAALLVLTFMKSEERLYSDEPGILTRCADYALDDDQECHHLVIGEFSLDGICIDVGDFDRAVYCGIGGGFREVPGKW